MSSTDSDLASLPQGPLTMSLLLGLTSAPLRRLLKAGLKRGLSEADLAELLQAEWGWSADSAEASSLLTALAERGWLIHHAPLQRWKTHLGNPSRS